MHVGMCILYTYMHVCVYMICEYYARCMHMCVCMYLSIYVYMHVCMYACMHVRLHAWMHACMHGSKYVSSEYVCMCLFMYICMDVCKLNIYTMPRRLVVRAICTCAGSGSRSRATSP